MRGLARLLVVCGLLLAGHFAAASEICLALADGDGKVFQTFPVALGERFTMRFTHSVARSPVEEVFEVTGEDEFTLRETVYADFGWGLPHEELPGQKMEFADGRIRLGGYAVTFREFVLRVGHIADHHIIVGGESVRLADFVRPGGAVGISLKRCDG